MASGPWETLLPSLEQMASEGSSPFSSVTAHEGEDPASCHPVFPAQTGPTITKFFLICVKYPQGQETWKLEGAEH